METNQTGRILLVDDNRLNRLQLSRVLLHLGYEVELAVDGQQAMGLIEASRYDLMLLDIMMPAMNGYQVLEQMKVDGITDLPVIVISALDDLESIVRCIEMGAEDYLTKPFDTVLLKARVGASLEKKRLRDQERETWRQLQREQEKSEQLLLNVLPRPIADRLKKGEKLIADSFNDVTVLFADITDFTQLSADLSARDLVHLLNKLFSLFDRLADVYLLEKIKTIGDSYMVAGGLPTPRADHAGAVADMSLAMLEAAENFAVEVSRPITMRMGIHSGHVVAGVIGTKKFSYDMWGDTVNTADRMQSHGLPGRIQVSETSYELLRDAFEFEERGPTQIKGIGLMQTYLLCGRKGSHGEASN